MPAISHFTANSPHALQWAPTNGVRVDLGHVTTHAYVRVHQIMTKRLALLAHWSVRQKLNRVSSVQLRRLIRTLTACIIDPAAISGVNDVVA